MRGAYDNAGSCGGGAGIVTCVYRNDSGFKTNAVLFSLKNASGYNWNKFIT